MRREPKNITEDKKLRSDGFASVVRSFGEANSRFQALAVESVGRAVVVQSQIAGKAYETYISEMSKLGKMFFVGFGAFRSRPQELQHATLTETADRPKAASAEAKINLKPGTRRSAAQSLSTKRKTGTVVKSQSGSSRSVKTKRKAGSVRRKK
jgi:hypothetical protein